MVDRAVDAMLERLDGEVPAYYVDFIREDVGREFMQSLDKQGMNLQQWMLQNKVEGDKMKEQVQTEAVRRASIDCAMEAMFTELGMEITDYPADFVNGCLIGAWDQIYQVILKERKDIPF